MKKKAILLGVVAILTSPNYLYAADESDVKAFFAKNKVGRSPDYGVIKNGMAGPELLMTVHGYADDKSACEGLIKQYNDDPSLSQMPGTYQCVPLNK